MKSVSILGSTGSVGGSTLDVVDAFPDRLKVVGLAAATNIELLARQIERYQPDLVSVRGENERERLAARIAGFPHKPQLLCGEEGAIAVATHDRADCVIAAIVGAAGIPPVYAAVRSGKRVGFANKEVLVAAGDVITRAAADSGGEILPIDSEHNAIHQALRCGTSPEVDRIILTASGGPFLRREASTFRDITIDDALAHPTWKMGSKISIDSATMMNKGLEVIEAHHLFQAGFDQIDILVHPQSIVHSMVEFVDGSIIAQMSTTDMRFPVQYALLYPERVAAPFAKLNLAQIRTLEFHEIDNDRFPAVRLAYEAGRAGGSVPAVLNAANEVAVSRFLAGEIRFPDIIRTVREVVDRHAKQASPVTSVEEALHWDAWGRNEALSVPVSSPGVNLRTRHA